MAKKERHDNGSEEGGWREGSKTSLKTTGSGSASGRVASKEPVDRPCPRRGGGARGLPQAGGRALLLAAAGTPTASAPGYCLCPAEHVQRARQTQPGSAALSAGDPRHATSPSVIHVHALTDARAHTRAHTCPDKRTESPKLGSAPHSYTVFGGTDFCFSRSYGGLSCQTVQHPAPQRFFS